MTAPTTKLTGILELDSSIRDIHECEDGYLLGNCEIAGTQFHCTFIRVKIHEEHGTQICDAPVGKNTDCPHEIFRDMQRLDEEPFRTIEVPGYPGDWVLVIQPFCD